MSNDTTSKFSAKDWLTLVAAVLAAAVSILNVTFNSWSQAKLEERKWVQVRQDDANRNLRVAIVDLARKLAIGNQKIQFLTWKAKYESENFSTTDINDYDTAMKALLPDIMASELTVAAMNEAIYHKLTPFTRKLGAMDASVAGANAEYRRDRKQGLDMLNNLNAGSEEYWMQLQEVTLGIVSNKDLASP